MKLLSWNVNGIRSALDKGFETYVRKEKPDILCIQEAKAHPEQVVTGRDLLPGYEVFWNSAERKGYSGTIIFSKIKPQRVTMGLGIAEHDHEGRVITLDLGDFYLVNVYTPNAQRELTRLQYRQHWDLDFLEYLKKLENKKPVIFCGDLNVAHKEIDLANPSGNRGNAGFTDEEREGFSRIIDSGFIDSFRQCNPEKGHYSWWSYMFNARAKNIGWRIDYFCLSKNLRPHLKDSFIQPHVLGSDHCPVGIILSS